MKITLDQQEVILTKVKEMLKSKNVEVILGEQSDTLMTPINISSIASKRKRNLLIIIENDDAVEYDKEELAKILAK